MFTKSCEELFKHQIFHCVVPERSVFVLVKEMLACGRQVMVFRLEVNRCSREL